MKRELVVDLWLLGVVLLALSVLIPFPWVEFKVRAPEADVVVYTDINPASDIKSSNGPTWTATLVFVCGAIIVGALALPRYFRWAGGSESGPWYLGEISLALAIASPVALALNPTPIYGVKEDFIGDEYVVANWYPHVGFYLVVLAIIILLVGQVQYRLASRGVRKVINIQAP